MGDAFEARPGSTPGTPPEIKVSVVVPVFNPGSVIEPCVESLLAQSLPASELEIIFVDDGSTDETPSRLHALTTEHEQIRIITIPNSGWPGKPRNVGTDSARGEFVMYVDQDDRLDPEALQRMYDLGEANAADVVLGKVTSDFRGVHQYLYRRQLPSCTVYDARLINSQTPHKMLRREFLAENGIRYPEGQRRLEDQLFMTKAYFAARTCSVVADYVCYRYLKRPDGGNAGTRRIDTEAYYQHLRDVLDVIDQHTSPGPVRDHFYRRFMRVEMLGKLAGHRVVKTRLENGHLWLVPIRALAEERFPTSVDAGLPATLRVRAHLMRQGTFADLKELTDRTRRLLPDVTLRAHHLAAGRAQLEVGGAFTFDGRPLLLRRDQPDRWRLPEEVTGRLETADLALVEPVGEMVADVVVVHRDLGDEWFVDRPLPITIDEAGSTARLVIAGSVTLDPGAIRGGRPLPPGRHDVQVRVDALGLTRVRPLVVEEEPGRTLAVVSAAPRTTLGTSPKGRVHLDVDVPARILRRRLSPVRASWTKGRLVIEFAAAWLASDQLSARLVTGSGIKHEVELSSEDGLSWRSARSKIPAGRYEVRVILPGVGAIETDGAVRVPLRPRTVLRSAARRLTTLRQKLA